MNFRTFIPAVAALAALTVAPWASAQAPGGQPPSAPIVRAIEVQYAGASTVSKEKILANMRTRVGRPYSEQAIEEDIPNLYKTGNIQNVRMFYEPATDGVKVIVVVQSRAKITEVRLNGILKVKESRIRKEISAKPGDVLDEASLEQDKQKIIKYYSDKGFTEVDVKYTSDINENLGTAVVS